MVFGPRGKATAVLAAALLLALAAGCAGLPKAGRRPVINLAGIEMTRITVLEQHYLIRLRVQNTAPGELSLKGLSLQLYLNGEFFASGVFNQPIEIAGLSEEVIEIRAVGSTYSLYRQLVILSRDKPERLTYRLTGRLHLENGGGWPIDLKGALRLAPGGGEFLLGTSGREASA